MAGLHEVEKKRVYQAPRELVWAIVSDTNRWDRAAGLAIPRYRWQRDGARLVRHASASELGIPLEWLEPPYGWIEGRFVEGEREFLKGPLEGGGFQVRLTDSEGGTQVSATAWVRAPWLIGTFQTARFSSALGRYLDGIGRVLDQANSANATEGGLEEPAVVRARRLLSKGYDAIASGPRTAPDEPTLAFRATRLTNPAVKDSVRAHLLAHLRERPDEEVSQMRPFELAGLWGEDRRDTLRTFLYATQAGLLELSWQVNCPICRVGARMVDGLAALDQKSHCGACEIDYEIDFGRHIEAVFSPAPAVRRVDSALYCASSPAFLPHVVAQLSLKPGAERTELIDIPPGDLHLRTLWVRRNTDLSFDARPARIEVVIDADSMTANVSGPAQADQPTELMVKNASSDPVAFLAERGAWSADLVLGTAIASLPEFTALFATEAPAAGVELKVGHVALLFSDLTGSTALYERVGDARAFAIVEDHFNLVSAAIGDHGGAIIKTMGDAVMASFTCAADAVSAGLAMVAVHDAKYKESGLGVKIGVFAGPCLAVRANERLDYFGTTVNVAARLQAQAEASEVVITAQMATEPAVQAVIGDRPCRPFAAKLKGIADEQSLLGIDAT